MLWTARAIASQPDVLLLAYSMRDGTTQVGLTYPSMVAHKQVLRDVASLMTYTGNHFKNVRITDAYAPVNASPHRARVKMTSVEFISDKSLDTSNHAFALESMVSALRPYQKLTLMFFTSPSFQFEGLRNYQNKYVTVRFEHRGLAFSYKIFIHDASFSKLNLPDYQPSPSDIQLAQTVPCANKTKRSAAFIFGFVALGIAAIALRTLTKFT